MTEEDKRAILGGLMLNKKKALADLLMLRENATQVMRTLQDAVSLLAKQKATSDPYNHLNRDYVSDAVIERVAFSDPDAVKTMLRAMSDTSIALEDYNSRISAIMD